MPQFRISLAAEEEAWSRRFQQNAEAAALRVHHERSTLSALLRSSGDPGLNELIVSAHASLSPWFARTIPIGGSIAFMSKGEDGRLRSVLRVFPAKGSSAHGLPYQVDFSRLLAHLDERDPTGQQKVLEAFPHNRPVSSNGDVRGGYLKSKDEIEHLAHILREHGKLIREYNRAIMYVLENNAKYGGLDLDGF
jgi:hypothetical protein